MDLIKKISGTGDDRFRS